MPSKKRATPVSLQPLDALFGTNEETTNGNSIGSANIIHAYTTKPIKISEIVK